MGYLLNVNEVLDFAIHIEHHGYEFYVESMKRFNDPDLLRLFQYLADEEFKHEKAFRVLRDSLGSFTPPDSYDGEYQAYMGEFCKAHALANRDVFRARLESLTGPDALLDMALEFEKDSVVFFTELKHIVGRDKHNAVDKVIREEMAHVRRIFDLKRERRGKDASR